MRKRWRVWKGKRRRWRVCEFRGSRRTKSRKVSWMRGTEKRKSSFKEEEVERRKRRKRKWKDGEMTSGQTD